jgi:spore photoproduct lyase
MNRMFLSHDIHETKEMKRMPEFVPSRVYVENGCEAYALGRILTEKYRLMGIDIVKIDNHNKIPELRERPDADFHILKKYLVLGIRKSLTHQRNNKTSDFLVPYTSSGCSAMCLYCYLVCTYYKSAYLRVFVNRMQMMEKLKKAAEKYPGSVFEIGSNSDLILENTISGSLEWTIEQFVDVQNARLTLPTKFDMVDSLLTLRHGHNVTIRMSLNPDEIIRRVEFGTSRLDARINALNKLYHAGYDTGILIAPIIILDGFEEMYEGLLKRMSERIDPEILRGMPLEIIFMTYGTVTKQINEQAFPGAISLYNKENMAFCGRSRYGYTQPTTAQASEFLKERIAHWLPEARIAYIV